jgi:hypothetical protein
LGFFKDLGKGMQNAKDAAADQQGNWAQQKAYADSINNPQGPPLADDEAGMQPIEGITLQRYAELAVGMQTMGTDTDAQSQYADANGVPQGRWMPIAQAWADRMAADPRVNKRFNELWREANARK